MILDQNVQFKIKDLKSDSWGTGKRSKYLPRAIGEVQIFTQLYFFLRFHHHNTSLIRVRRVFRENILHKCNSGSFFVFLPQHPWNHIRFQVGGSLMYCNGWTARESTHHADYLCRPSHYLRCTKHSFRSPSYWLTLPLPQNSVILFPPIEVLVEERLL